MITTIAEAPSNIVAFRVEGTVTKEDYDKVVFPAVDELVKRTGKLNYLMLIDAPLSNFTGGAWIQDALLGIKKLSKWHKAAILTDSDTANAFTDIFSKVVPGEFKGFRKYELPEAMAWVAA